MRTPAIRRRANKLMLRVEDAGVLSAEDWYLDDRAPQRAGNDEGYWVPVWVFVKKPRKLRPPAKKGA